MNQTNERPHCYEIPHERIPVTWARILTRQAQRAEARRRRLAPAARLLAVLDRRKRGT